MERLFNSCCGYDYCICGQNKSRVKKDELSLEVKISSQRIYISTLRKAGASLGEIMEAEHKLGDMITNQ